jgi:hypothetical protein
MKSVVTVLMFLQSVFVWAQQAQKSTHDFADATFAVGSYQGSLSLLYVHNWRLGSSKKFGVGVGGRITSYLGANQYYITAPARLTSESTSPLIFFKENIIKNIDSLLIQSPQVTAINASINIDYQLSSKLTAGFNIDLIGFSFGARKRGNYINGQQGKNTQGNPTSFNALLISDNDRGSLNSELTLKYKVNEKWSVKTGAQFLFTEYATETKVQQLPSENDRFRRKSLLFALGVSYHLK